MGWLPRELGDSMVLGLGHERLDEGDEVVLVHLAGGDVLDGLSNSVLVGGV